MPFINSKFNFNTEELKLHRNKIQDTIFGFKNNSLLKSPVVNFICESYLNSRVSLKFKTFYRNVSMCLNQELNNWKQIYSMSTQFKLSRLSRCSVGKISCFSYVYTLTGNSFGRAIWFIVKTSHVYSVRDIYSQRKWK